MQAIFDQSQHIFRICYYLSDDNKIKWLFQKIISVLIILAVCEYRQLEIKAMVVNATFFFVKIKIFLHM